MSGAPIELERHVCQAIAGSLRAGDVVSAVVWDVSNAVIMDSHVVSGPDDSELLALCRSLSAGGGTNLHGGLEAGYDLARRNFDPGAMNRVVIVSDGQANVGITDEELIAEMADDSEGEAIFLVGVGVGLGYNDTMMDVVTDAGKGAYVFVDTEAEAYKIFGQRFQSTMEIAVMDVQVELGLPSWLRVDEFHGEEISTDPREVEPQHLAPNDAMVFHQLLKSCTEMDPSTEIHAMARYMDPVTRERTSDEVTLTIGEMLAATDDFPLLKGTAVVEYAEGLKEIARLVKDGDVSGAQEFCLDLRDSLDATAALVDDDELDDIRALVGRYCGNIDDGMWPGWY
jgi:Ca-activated chloride channel family protein